VRLTQFKQGVRRSVDPTNPETELVTYDDSSAVGKVVGPLVGPGGVSPISSEIQREATSLINNASSLPVYSPDLKSFDIERFTPYLETVNLENAAGVSVETSIASTGSYRKNLIRKSLYRKNAGTFRKCDWAYSNAHSINFFTDPDTSVSTNPQQHAIIYPDPTGSDGSANYRPDAGFTFEFYINPRYTTKNNSTAFDAGTILHYSSAYALSLVSGSNTDTEGRPDGFRLLLQLSSSADTPPDEISLSGPPAGSPMVYSSSDNSLTRGKWHHVAVRWGGLDVQDSTGSFVIDGLIDSTFIIPSASITAPAGSTQYAGFSDRDDANALFLGNFVRGSNPAAGGVKNFFNSNAAANEGVITWPNAGIGTSDPSNTLKNKLNAEIHEVRIFKEHRDIEQIKEHMNLGFSKSQFENEKSGSLAFYLPPLFVVESPARKSFRAPFSLVSSAKPSFTPFSVTSSFTNEMFSLNAPNFFRDFANSRYPRFFNLTGSTSLTANDDQPSNQQTLQDPQITARNFLIMPNDNGSFNPDYTLLLTGTFSQLPTTSSLLRRFVNDRGVTDLSIISLNRMLGGKKPVKHDRLPTDNLYEPVYSSDPQPFFNDQRFDSSDESAATRIESNRIISPTFDAEIRLRPDGILRRNSPSSPAAGGFNRKTFYVFEATGDESSNQAVFFNIPNIFYGKRIKPGTLTVKDPGMTGSYGKVSMTLRDDGFGSLYRSDSSNPNKLHSVGNVFYEDGIVAIKSPHLFSFGSGSFEIGFEGTQEIFNREMYIEAPSGLVNSSSNATFEKLAPTDDANETADEFVYITQVLLHDKDLNVVGRATVSQPIKKRPTDSITFKLKKDY
jgi:hypothetical protein